MPPRPRKGKTQNAEVPAGPAAQVAPAISTPAELPPTRSASISDLLSRAKSDPVAAVRDLLCERQYFWLMAGLLTAFNLVFGILIINRVSYTKIDWDAYMQQVDMFLSGEKDYSKIEGETGPLVYPALHLYIYTFLHNVLPAHGRERPAQYIWLFVELATFLLTSAIYYAAGKTKHIPQYLLIPLVLSKRSHSIYLLRLFNDPLAMLFLYTAVLLFMYGYWKIGTVIYSLAIAIKMNILLFLPGIIVIMFQYRGFFGVVDGLIVTTFVQIGLPSLSFGEEKEHFKTYFRSAFDFSREFLYQWTVNWRFVPEPVFLSKSFARGLLLAHAALIIAFGLYRWSPVPGGTGAVLRRGLYNARALFKPAVLPGQLHSAHIPLVLFTSNLIGMACARSLHYQFHAWYFHQLPLLLYLGGAWGQTPILIGILLVLERAWDTYPSTRNSSFLLLAMHAAMIAGLWVCGPRPPTATSRPPTTSKTE